MSDNLSSDNSVLPGSEQQTTASTPGTIPTDSTLIPGSEQVTSTHAVTVDDPNHPALQGSQSTATTQSTVGEQTTPAIDPATESAPVSAPATDTATETDRVAVLEKQVSEISSFLYSMAGYKGSQ